MQLPLRLAPLALLRLAVCALLAGGLPVGAAAQIAVTGIELDVDDERERLMVFADAPLTAREIEVDERTFMLALPGAQLDPSAPTQIAPTAQGMVRRVNAFDHVLAGGAPEVRLVVQRRPGEPPRVGPGGRVLTVDFEPMSRPRATEQEGAVTIGYRGVPLRRFVTDVARATGQRFVFDESLAGTVTIEGPDTATREEALALLDSVLLMRGFAALPSPGGARVIVPIAGAAAPFVGGAALPDGDALTTALLRLEEAGVEALVTALAPYLGSNVTASAFAPTNSVILSGPSSRLRRLRGMIEALDAIEPVRALIWPVYYAEAATVAGQLAEILDEEGQGGAEVERRISADARSNSLLLRLRADEVERARRMVDRLDRPALGPGAIQVLKLRHADPEQMAEILTTLRGGAAAPSAAGEPVRAAGLAGQDYQVVVDAPTGSLVIRAEPETFSALLDVVRELDRQPAAVRVEVGVASITLEGRLELGIDYLIPTLTNPRSTRDLIATVLSDSDGDGVPSQGDFTTSFTRAPLVLPILDPTTGEPVVIPRESGSLTLSGGTVRNEVLVRPQLLVSSGQEQKIFAGDNIPIPVGRAVEGQNPVQITRDIQRQDVGTTLRVLPTVGQRGPVVLELTVEVSTLGDSAAGDVARVGPSIREIDVQSLIRLAHGEVAVIATAAQPVTQSQITGVPWLKDLPWLGVFFRSTREQTLRRHLLITAQAEVVNDESRALAARLEGLARNGR